MASHGVLNILNRMFYHGDNLDFMRGMDSRSVYLKGVREILKFVSEDHLSRRGGSEQK